MIYFYSWIALQRGVIMIWLWEMQKKRDIDLKRLLLFIDVTHRLNKNCDWIIGSITFLKHFNVLISYLHSSLHTMIDIYLQIFHSKAVKNAFSIRCHQEWLIACLSDTFTLFVGPLRSLSWTNGWKRIHERDGQLYIYYLLKHCYAQFPIRKSVYTIFVLHFEVENK